MKEEFRLTTQSKLQQLKIRRPSLMRLNSIAQTPKEPASYLMKMARPGLLMECIYQPMGLAFFRPGLRKK